MDLVASATPEVRNALRFNLGAVPPADVKALDATYRFNGQPVTPPDEPSLPIIEPFTPPWFTGPIAAGETFDDLTARADKGTTRIVGNVEDEVQYAIAIGIDWISSGTELVAPGDHFTGYRGVYTAGGWVTAYGPVIKLDIYILGITTSLPFYDYENVERGTLADSDFLAPTANPGSYSSNVSATIIVSEPAISGALSDATSRSRPET